MTIDNATINADHDFRASYDQATVVVPACYAGGKIKRGKMTDMIELLLQLKSAGGQYLVLIFLQGSRYLQYEQRIANWIVDRFNIILIAPATHELAGRPGYTSPTATEIYQRVHRYRLNELDYVVNRLADLIALDDNNLLLMGQSEGAVAVGTWQGKASARILLAWSCEHNYFSRDHVLAGDCESTWMLNIVGSKDEYFANENSLSSEDGVTGHGTKNLSRFKNAKVIIYPGWGHRILEHPNAGYDIAAFVEQFCAGLETD